MNVSSPYAPAAAVQVAVDETRVGQTDQAISDLEMLSKAIPDDVTAWTALGDAYRGDEKFDKAADAYDHAVKALGTAGAKDWPLFYARAVAEEQRAALGPRGEGFADRAETQPGSAGGVELSRL